jgi:polar amino acid transport system substrate-binding protein
MISRRDIAGLAGLGAVTLAAAVQVASPAAAQTAPGESTFDRIRRTRKLRIAGIVGTEPYYHRDIVSNTWTGFCVSMGQDLAKSMEAELEISETTWGNAVLDLQTNKIDIMFGLSPTPSRALVVEFTTPIMNNTFTIIARPGFEPKTWDELNKPEVRVAVDIGSSHDLYARRALPKATLVALQTPDAATLAVQSGRADCVIQVILLSMTSVKKNPKVGKLIVPTPVVAQPTAAGVRVDADQRFLSYVNNWLEYNRSLTTVRGWIVDNLAMVGIQPEDIPPSVQF